MSEKSPEVADFDPPDEYDEDFVLEPTADLAFERAVKLRHKVTAKAKAPDSVVLSNGTNMMGRPIPVVAATEMGVLNNLLCREELYPSGPLPPISPTIIGLENVMTAIATGADVGRFKENIEQVVSNQPEKGELLKSYLNQADREALVDGVVMRASSLRVIKQASARADISISEALVIWRLSNDLIDRLKRGVGEDEKPVDGEHVVGKIDYSKLKAERETKQRWEGTTPQGRELIRKIVWTEKRRLLLEQGIKPTGITPIEVTEPTEEETKPFDLPENPPAVTLAQPP